MLGRMCARASANTRVHGGWCGRPRSHSPTICQVDMDAPPDALAAHPDQKERGLVSLQVATATLTVACTRNPRRGVLRGCAHHSMRRVLRAAPRERRRDARWLGGGHPWLGRVAGRGALQEAALCLWAGTRLLCAGHVPQRRQQLHAVGVLCVALRRVAAAGVD